MLCALPAVRAALAGRPGLTSAPRHCVPASSPRRGRPTRGTPRAAVDLGLPVLPDLQGVSRLFDSTTDQEVWYLSPGHWRADGLSAAGESDVCPGLPGDVPRDYTDNLLTRIVGAQPVRLPRSPDLLPPPLGPQASWAGLSADHLSRLPSLRVAGVDAAGLRLVPADPATTIGAIDIWADPADGLPVEVRIMARGVDAPVLVASFLELSQRRPAFATVIPHPDPGVDAVTARLSSLNGVLNGDGDGDVGGNHFRIPCRAQAHCNPRRPHRRSRLWRWFLSDCPAAAARQDRLAGGQRGQQRRDRQGEGFRGVPACSSAPRCLPSCWPRRSASGGRSSSPVR